ncbi:MAG: IclR family transcriptional regulator [Neisseria sp.]|nr:IclR family transcriptional regulator [Neisseria sp.]
MADNTISSVADTLRLLNNLAEHPNIGLSELARLSELNKSRTYRMLCTLMQSHFVQQTEHSRYVLGHRLLQLGQAARNHLNWLQTVEACCAELRERFNENLQVRVSEGLEMVQVWRHASTQTLQVRSAAGNRRDLGAGASGKLLLAFADEHTQNDYFAQKMSSANEAEIAVLREQLAHIRSAGIAITQGELTAGVCAFAVPLLDASGRCFACLSLSAPQSRTDAARADELANALIQTGKDISTRLGFHS